MFFINSLYFHNFFTSILFLFRQIISFTSWDAYKQLIFKVIIFKFSFYDIFSYILLFYFHYCYLLNSYMFLLLIVQIPSLFFHLIYLLWSQQRFCFFFHLEAVFLIHNLKYQITFQNLWQYLFKHRVLLHEQWKICIHICIHLT